MENEQHINQSLLSFLKVYKKNLLGLVIILIVFLSVNYNQRSSKDYSGESSSRFLSSIQNDLDFNSTSNEEEEEEKYIELPFNDEIKNFYKSIKHFYVGTWRSNHSLKDMDKMHGIFQFRTNYATYNQSITGYEFKHLLVTNILLYDNNYIDKWTDIRINGPFLENYTIFDFDNQTIIAKKQFSKIYRGEILEKKSEQYCYLDTSYTYKNNTTFDYNSNRSLSQISTIKGSIKSNCSINIEFEAEINLDNDNDIKGRNYFIFSSFIALCQVLNSLWLFNRLTKFQSHANCLSLITICQSVVWNSYGCLCHFFMAIIFDKYIKFFGIPALIYFLNFTIFEIRLLYKTWASQNVNNRYDTFEMRRKMMKYYVIFYIFIFLSLFLVTKFYFIKSYIFAAVITTWIPQIIFNFMNNNKTSLPLLSVIIMSLNKLMIPAYFRGCPANFFHISSDSYFIFSLVCILIMEIIILYLQNIYGPRFFFPFSIPEQQQRHNYYKNKSELLASYPDLERADCVICLIPIVYNETCLLATVSNDLNHSINLQSLNNQASNQMITYSNRKLMIKALKHYLFDFHEVSNKKNFGEYMVTPCNHIFHSECLEGWIKQNRICPTCRNIIPEA